MRSFDHMGVGHDVAVRIYDHARTHSMLADDQRRLTPVMSPR